MIKAKPTFIFDQHDCAYQDQLRIENADLRRELELARRVADAAAAGYIVWHAYSRVRVIEPVDYEAGAELLVALDPTRAALSSAVREYRARVEAAAFMAQPAVRRGLEGVGEMEED